MFYDYDLLNVWNHLFFVWLFDCWCIDSQLMCACIYSVAAESSLLCGWLPIRSSNFRARGLGVIFAKPLLSMLVALCKSHISFCTIMLELFNEGFEFVGWLGEKFFDMWDCKKHPKAPMNPALGFHFTCQPCLHMEQFLCTTLKWSMKLVRYLNVLLHEITYVISVFQ